MKEGLRWTVPRSAEPGILLNSDNCVCGGCCSRVAQPMGSTIDNRFDAEQATCNAPLMRRVILGSSGTSPEDGDDRAIDRRHCPRLQQTSDGGAGQPRFVAQAALPLISVFLRGHCCASFRISTSSVLRPSCFSNSRMRASSLRTSKAPTTSSPDSTGAAPPAANSLRHLNRRSAATPWQNFQTPRRCAGRANRKGLPATPHGDLKPMGNLANS